MSQTCSQNVPNKVQKMFPKCPKNVLKCSQNVPNTFQNCPKELNNIINKKCSGRSISDVFFNILHPVNTLTREQSLIVQIFILNFFVSKFGFPQGFEGFGRFGRLREACTKNFHVVPPLITPGVRSSDQKNKKVNDQKI